MTDQITPVSGFHSAVDQLKNNYPTKPLMNALNDVFIGVMAKLEKVKGMEGVYTTTINPPITFIEIEENPNT